MLIEAGNKFSLASSEGNISPKRRALFELHGIATKKTVTVHGGVRTSPDVQSD
jgi:hypothetical protein